LITFNSYKTHTEESIAIVNHLQEQGNEDRWIGLDYLEVSRSAKATRAALVPSWQSRVSLSINE
jgi:hypothetical protein